MQGAKEEVECQATVGQIGEVGEEVPRMICIVMAIVPTKDGEDSNEGIKREESADEGEDNR